MNNVYLLGLGVVLSMSVACAAPTGQEEPQGSGTAALDNGQGAAPKSAASSDPGTPKRGAIPDPGTPKRGAFPEPNPVPPSALCSGQTMPGPDGPTGLASPAVYCTNLGYHLDGDQCTFEDGTSCEQSAFLHGECGQKHSLCERQGGQLSVRTSDMGGSTSTYTYCTFATGKSCPEEDFAASCQCGE